MISTTCSTLNCLHVRLQAGRVQSVLAPLSSTGPGPRLRLTIVTNTLSRRRHLTTRVSFPASVKSKKGSSKTNTRIVADHYDLNSFIRYQTTTGTNINSTVALGTRYEYLVQKHLQDKLGFSLTRIGGKGDGGIDLIGTWTIPELAAISSANAAFAPAPKTSTTFRVLIQAKRLSSHRKPMPSLMRELEGTLESSSSMRSISEAFQYHLLRKREEHLKGSASVSNYKITPIQTEAARVDEETFPALPTLAILVTTNPLTAGIQTFMSGSRSSLMYVCLQEMNATNSSEINVPSTSIQQIAWNATAAQAGLEGLDVGMRYATSRIDPESSTTSLSSYASREAVIMREGHPIQFA